MCSRKGSLIHLSRQFDFSGLSFTTQGFIVGLPSTCIYLDVLLKSHCGFDVDQLLEYRTATARGKAIRSIKNLISAYKCCDVFTSVSEGCLSYDVSVAPKTLVVHSLGKEYLKYNTNSPSHRRKSAVRIDLPWLRLSPEDLRMFINLAVRRVDAVVDGRAVNF